MSLLSISILVLVFAVTLYFIFLLLGVGGIEKNRKAQGFDQKN